MEPYKAKKLPLEYYKTGELFRLICDVEGIYGEYKGFLKSMDYDYKSYLECAYIRDLYYSFKIDGSKLEKEYMFHTSYMNNNNDVIEFNNLKKALVIGASDISKGILDINTLHSLNKCLFNGCKKTNNTKGSGKFRKIQNYLLKPGIAGSSVSFIPPVYSEVNDSVKDLINYINNNDDVNLISTIMTHYQFEKIHPYVSGNGKIGRLLMALQFALYKHEPPILFISESLEKLKNTYFTLLSGEIDEDFDKFLKTILQCIIDECKNNIAQIKKLNKIYKTDYESFKSTIGGTTIYKVYPVIVRKIVFTTHDLVSECNLHINSVNKVLNKLVDEGYLIKEKKNGTNRVTFCYKNMYEVFTKEN